MHHFFVEPSNITGTTIIIDGEDVNHIKNVLRMKNGEEISISNGIDNREFRCIVERIEEGQVVCKVIFIKEDGVELPARITLFQGLPKQDKMELIIQKAVELGVYEIVPVITNRAVVKLDEKKARAKQQRWQAISEAAAKQSQRAIVPMVTMPMTFAEAIDYSKKLEVCSIPYELAEGMEATKTFISKAVDSASIGVFIGPEGGFSEDEIDKAKREGIEPISLGKRILRTETAPISVLSILMYELEIRGENNGSLS